MFILTIANTILIQPPPFPNADRLMRLWIRSTTTGATSDVSFLDANDVQARSLSFEALEVAVRTRLAITTSGSTERVRGESVSAGYFDLIATRPALGRGFTKEEYAAGGSRNILISHSLWLRAFGGRTNVLGETLRARANDGQGTDGLFTIIGVMPKGFVGTVDPDISEFWLPVQQYLPRSGLDRRTSRGAWVLAKLHKGISPGAAQVELGRITSALAAEHPADYRDRSLTIEPVGETWRTRFREGLAMLTSASVLLLLIACVNVSQLMMARVARQEHETRIRLALGATRAMLTRQLVVESTVIATAGGLLGFAGAILGVKLFEAASVFQLPPYVAFHLDFSTVIIASAVLFVTAIASSVVPSWLGSRMGAGQLRDGGRSTTAGRQQRRSVNTLISAQVACSFVLLFGAALMLRTYANLVRADVGYATENVLRLAISLDARVYPDNTSYLQFARDAKVALAAESGVRGVSFMAGVLPPWNDPTVAIAVRGEPWPHLSAITTHAVDEDFFRVLSIPLVAGRAIGPEDRSNSVRVAVISQSLARAISPASARAALGQTIEVLRPPGMGGPTTIPVSIIGIAQDVQYQGPLRPRPADYDLYVPMNQSPDATLSIAVSTSGDPALLLLPAQALLSSLAPSSPLHWVSTMKSELALQYGDARLYAWLTTVFGGAALLLVAIGIYGVLSNSVARRLQELGLRIAIGATPGNILELVIREAMSPLAVGLGIGTIIAVASAPLAQSLVYGMAPTNALTFVAVIASILVFGLVASFLPARRATAIDPLTALRGK